MIAPLGASMFVLVFTLLRGAKDSMWFDESFTFWVAKLDLGSFLELIWSKEPNMGPYYMAMWLWIRVDDSDLWIRSFSALCTVAAVWGIWMVVRKWSGASAAGLAVGVFVLTPFVLSWSMQARGYSMAMALVSWSLYFADGLLRDERFWPTVMFGVTVGLGVATQVSTVFVFIGIIVAILVSSPGRITVERSAWASLVAALVFAPFAFAVIKNPQHGQWVPELTFDVFTTHFTRALSGPAWGLLIASGWVCLVVESVRRVDARRYLIALVGSVSGILGVILISLLGKPMFIDRYLIGYLPLAVIAAVGGWVSVSARRLPIMSAVIVGIAVLVLTLSLDRTRPKPEDYRGAVAFVEMNGRSSDAIVALGEYPILGMNRYLPEGTPTESIRRSPTDPESFVITSKDRVPYPTNRVWVVTRWDDYPVQQEEWIEREFPVVVIEESFGTIRLQLRQVAINP